MDLSAGLSQFAHFSPLVHLTEGNVAVCDVVEFV